MPGKHHLRGSNKHPKKNRFAASRLVDDAPHRHYFGHPPPLSKKLDPPLSHPPQVYEPVYATDWVYNWKKCIRVFVFSKILYQQFNIIKPGIMLMQDQATDVCSNIAFNIYILLYFYRMHLSGAVLKLYICWATRAFGGFGVSCIYFLHVLHDFLSFFWGGGGGPREKFGKKANWEK